MTNYTKTSWGANKTPTTNSENLNKLEGAVHAVVGYTTADEIRALGTPTNVFSVTLTGTQGGRFVWDPNSNDYEDGVNGSAGNVILPTNHTGFGRWIRESDTGSAGNFGAVGDLYSSDGVLNTNPTDDTASLLAAVAKIRLSKTGATIDGKHKGYSINNQLRISQGDCGMEKFHIKAADDFAGTDAASNGALLSTSSGLNIGFKDIVIDGNNVANGIMNINNGFSNRYKDLKIQNFKDFGIKLEGSGDQKISGALIDQSAEVADRVAGSIGVDVQTGDVKISDSVIRYCDIPLRVSYNTLLSTGNHFYNGSAGSTTPATDSTNIVVDGGSGGSFCHTYLDKGMVRFKNKSVAAFFDTKLLFNSVPEHDSVFHVTAAEPAQGFPDFVFDGCKSTIPLNNGRMKFIEFQSSATNGFTDEAISIKNEINLRNHGHPRLVSNEVFKLAAPSRTVMVDGGTQTIKHSLSSLSYAQNTTNGVDEIYSASSVSFAASGISHNVVGKGASTSVKSTLVGSRTGATEVSSSQMWNRRGSSELDEAAATGWETKMVGGNAGDDYLIMGYSPSSQAEHINQFIYTTAAFHPANSNDKTLGTSSKLWSTVYASTGAINTSDDRLKTYLDIDEAEAACAKELKGLMKKFKFNSAINEKGEDKARIHFGTSAQSVIEVFKSHGLDANDYALLCHDVWEAEYDEDGNVTLEAGDRYGVRYEELLCFIISAM